jgi:hypothetical protein
MRRRRCDVSPRVPNASQEPHAANVPVIDYMAGLVLKSALNNPVFTAKFGNAVRIRQYWLEIHYPLRAPPVYERSGYVRCDPTPYPRTLLTQMTAC